MADNSHSSRKKDIEGLKLKTLLINQSEIEELLSIKDVLKAVEKAFKLKAQGKTIMPAKIYLELPEYQGDFRAMPAYIDGSAGMKWVSVYPNNRQYNLPAVMALIILCDPDNSYPLAIMDGTFITSLRTGATGGIAVKYLARRDSSVIGMVGAGRQAETQLLAISEVLPGIKEVKVFDLYEEASRRYAEKLGAKLNIKISPVKTVAAAAEADIVVTTTPSRKPVVKKQYIRPGTHINAIGADAPGKQELEADLLKSAKIVVDDFEQACHSGEINVPLSKGQLKAEDIHSTLGEVVAGMKKGRENDEEITIFDSTGLAIQDIICAKLVYEKARKGKTLDFDFMA
jgi:alanine dehydrogenase